MNDRIDEIEEQAKVILEWCRQQRLPEEDRDILEFRDRHPRTETWTSAATVHPTNINLYDFRLRKRPKTHTATVYWRQHTNGQVFPSLKMDSYYTLIGTTTVEFTEPQE